MAVEKFVQGERYIWVGPKDFRSNWADQMDLVKDGQPRTWVSATPGSSGTSGRFDGQDDTTGVWAWGHVLQYFIKYDDDDILGLFP